MTLARRSFYFLTGLFTAGAFVVTLGQGFGGAGFGSSGSGVSSADPTFTGIVTMPIAAAPTTDADGECAFDADAWAAGRDALECFDGTASTYLIGVLVSDAPAAGQVPKWQTGGTITWENDDNAGAATELDDIADPSGNGAVSTLVTTHVWTSTLDAASTFMTWLFSDVDVANATVGFSIDNNDSADADFTFLRLRDDVDGTPRIVFGVTQTQATFGVDVTIPADAYDATDWNGVQEAAPKDAVRDIIETFVVPDAEVATWLVTPSSANLLAAVDDETGTGLAVFATSPTFTTSIIVGTAGVSLADDGDGAITFLGRGNGSDEDLTLNLDDTANTGVFSSSTGLATIDWGGFALINLVLNVESTNVSLTTTHEVTFPVAVCQNATATLGGNTATTLGPTAVCESVTAAQAADVGYGTATFPTGGADTEWHQHFGRLPTGWTGNFDAIVHWRAVSTTAADVVWRVATGCLADAQAPTDISFNTTSVTADANKGTTLQLNDTATTTLTMTGCAAGEQLFFKVLRDTDTAGDTLDQDVQLIAITFIYRRTQ